MSIPIVWGVILGTASAVRYSSEYGAEPNLVTAHPGHCNWWTPETHIRASKGLDPQAAYHRCKSGTDLRRLADTADNLKVGT
jgi:hypothetical protein